MALVLAPPPAPPPCTPLQIHPRPPPAFAPPPSNACNLGDRHAHAWEFIRFQLRLDEADGLDFQNLVWSSIRSRVSPAGVDRASARLLSISFRPSSLQLDEALVATLLQFRFGGVATEFAVARTSTSCFVFFVACDLVADRVIACSPISSEHYFANISAPLLLAGGQPSTCLIQPTSSPNPAPRPSSSAVGPGAASSLLPPRTAGSVGGASSAALAGPASSTSTSQRGFRFSSKVRPFRPGFAFSKFISLNYRCQVTSPHTPPKQPNDASFWIVATSNSVIPSTSLVNGALDHRFASQNVFNCLSVSTSLFRAQAFSPSVRNEIVCRSPVPFSNFKLQLFTCPVRARDAAVPAAVQCVAISAARASMFPPSILGVYHTPDLIMPNPPVHATNEDQTHAHPTSINTATSDCSRDTSHFLAVSTAPISPSHAELPCSARPHRRPRAAPSCSPTTQHGSSPLARADLASQPRPIAFNALQPETRPTLDSVHRGSLAETGPPACASSARPAASLSGPCMPYTHARTAAINPSPPSSPLSHASRPLSNPQLLSPPTGMLELDCSAPMPPTCPPLDEHSQPRLSYRDVLLSTPNEDLSQAPAYIPPTPHHTHSPSSSPKFKNRPRCFRCLASDHLVDVCRDPVRCSRCWRSGHRSHRCKSIRLLPFFPNLPSSPESNPAFLLSGGMAHTSGTHTASGSSANASDDDMRPLWFGRHCVFVNNRITPSLPTLFDSTGAAATPTLAGQAVPASGPPLFIPSAAALSSRRGPPTFAPSPAFRSHSRSPANSHTYMPPPSANEMPLIAPPPCLIMPVDHLCFIHLASPMHNPFGFIKRAIRECRGNHSVAVTSSSRGAALLSFSNRDIRWIVTGLGDIEFEGNTLSFERVEHTDNRAMANFQDLMEIEANDFPHELWHEDGVKYFFAHLGSVSALDQYCVGSGDFVSVRALVMVTRGKRLPPGMVVLLPEHDLITVTLTQLDFRAHGIGPDDPSPFSSDDCSDGGSNDSHASAVHEAVLREFAERARGRGPPPSPRGSLWARRAHAAAATGGASSPPAVLAMHPGDVPPALLVPATPVQPADAPLLPVLATSPQPAAPPAVVAVDACMLLTLPTTAPAATPAPSSTIAATRAPAAAVVLPQCSPAEPQLSFSVAATSNASSSATISDLAIHDNTIRKRAVHSQRVVSAAKLRRSARIAERETPFYVPMATKASRVKAAKFLSNASVELAAAAQGSSLCVSDDDDLDVDDAADKLALVALVCGADADEADAIRAAGARPSP